MASHTYSEDEVNRMLGEQADKHRDAMESQATNHKLEKIDFAVKSIEEKVCRIMSDEKEEKDQILQAISKSGDERRECEQKVNSRIDDVNEYNHKTFVKKADLRMYAIIIIFAVTGTTGFITWLGTQSTNNQSNISADKMAEKIIKKMRE